MTRGKNYVMSSNDFDFEFIYAKTERNKVISKDGVIVCDIKEVKKLKNVRINEK